MGKIVGGMTVSLDGFVNDRHGDVRQLYPDLGSLGKTEMLLESIANTGAVVMGRHAYEMAHGDLTGYEYQVPIFVVTHEQAWAEPRGQNDKLRVSFVADGVESAIRKAKAAAGNKDVTIIGGANTLQQVLQAGLVDELHVGIMPIFLNDGLRFFEHLEGTSIRLEKTNIFESAGGRTDLIFQVVK